MLNVRAWLYCGFFTCVYYFHINYVIFHNAVRVFDGIFFDAHPFGTCNIFYTINILNQEIFHIFCNIFLSFPPHLFL